jgi:hypothetical protein
VVEAESGCKLRFLDLLLYAPGNDLRKLVETFGGANGSELKDVENKGLFP